MEDKYAKAKHLFVKEKYNCAQAVACAFCQETGIPEEQLRALAASFGGGMGRLREVCGAVSGALLYARVQEFARRFSKENGHIVCRELLKLRSGQKQSPIPDQRTSEYYAARPCPEIVASGARILEQMLRQAEQEEAQQ